MSTDQATASDTKDEEKNEVNVPESEDDNSESEDDADDDYDYYFTEDTDALADQMIKRNVEDDKMEEERFMANFCDHSGSRVAVKRLIKDMKSMSTESIKFGIAAKPIANNLFVWEVQFLDIPEDSKLGCDLAQYSKKYKTEPVIHLNMQFSQDYPFSPPFIRVVRPRFQFMTGHVTNGGSICMQMLTKSGWQPTNDIESILVQVRAQLLSDPKAALDPLIPNTEYSEHEAKMAFERMVHKYGW